MSFRYQRRVNIGNGLGLNLSRSGVGGSYRGKWGSIGSTGFSIRTGIPGLSFRKYSRRNKNDGFILLAILLFIAIAWLVAVVAWNLVRLISYLIGLTIRRVKAWQLQREVNIHAHNDAIVHVFAGDLKAIGHASPGPWQLEWLVREKAVVNEDQAIAIFSAGGQEAVIRAEASGELHPIAVSEADLKADRPIYKIKKQKK